MAKLPFGKKVMCGDFYVQKHTRALGSKELKKMRKAQGIPEDIQKHLSRGVLPYITIGTVTDSWKIQFVIGMTTYEAIDEIPVAVDGDGNYTYYGNGRINLGNIINGWFAYTSTVGDPLYQAQTITAMQDYLDRMSHAPMTDDEKKAWKNTLLASMQGAMDKLKGIEATDKEFMKIVAGLHKTMRLGMNKFAITVDHSQPLSKEENEKVMQESEDNEKHKTIIIKMSNEIQKEGEKNDGKGND